LSKCRLKPVPLDASLSSWKEIWMNDSNQIFPAQESLN